jgi:hypothetical protein
MAIINSQELATLLDGFNHEDRFTKHTLKIARESGLIIVSSIGDDTVVFNGAMTEEFDLFQGGDIFMDKDGFAYTRQKVDKSRKKITSIWEDKSVFKWKFITSIPNSCFSIKRAGKNYCKGIIFNTKDV